MAQEPHGSENATLHGKDDGRAIDALITQGHALEDSGQPARALERYEEAVRREPGYARGWLNVGNALVALGRLDEARVAYARAASLEPSAAAELNCGNLEMRCQQPSVAVRHYRRALAIKPGWRDAHWGLCIALQQASPADALSELRRFVEENPDHAPARVALAGMLAASATDEAISVLDRAPYSPDMLAKSAKLHYERLDHREAADTLERALCLDPSNQKLASAYAFHSINDPFHEPERFTANLARHCVAKGWRRIEMRRRRHGGRIRVGYLSGDFAAHALMHYALPLVAGHDRRRFEVILVDSTPSPDHVTSQYRRLADAWLDIGPHNDEDACALVRNAGIDILVDLSSHTNCNRLGVLARRAAPVQMTSLGLLMSTGISNVDYRIADVHTDPPGMTEAWHTEALLRLSRFNGAYEMQRAFPQVSSLPALANGYVTFGYFNHELKLGRAALALYAEVLLRTPGSRIRFVGIERESIRRVILDVLEKQHGIDPRRIAICGRLPLADFSAALASVDIAFDAFPYCGGITSIETLLAGVPFAALAGRRPSSRNGLAILRSAHLDAWAFESPEDFVDGVCRQACDLEALSRLRGELQARLSDSALMDCRGFVAAWEGLFERVLEEPH